MPTPSATSCLIPSPIIVPSTTCVATPALAKLAPIWPRPVKPMSSAGYQGMRCQGFPPNRALRKLRMAVRHIVSLLWEIGEMSPMLRAGRPLLACDLRALRRTGNACAMAQPGAISILGMRLAWRHCRSAGLDFPVLARPGRCVMRVHSIHMRNDTWRHLRASRIVLSSPTHCSNSRFGPRSPAGPFLALRAPPGTSSCASYWV